ncbi:MAG: cellulase family glycosylhydrolase [Acidimicrobiales bacterium]
MNRPLLRRAIGRTRRYLVPVVGAVALILLTGSLAAGVGGWSTPARAVSAPNGPSSIHRRIATGIAGTDGSIGHAGRWLTDSQGRVVLLHGVNLVAKGTATPAQEGFGARDANWLVTHGFDVVRLGTTASALMPEPGKIDYAYLRSFVSTVNLLTAHGLLVLVDLHQDGWGPTLGSDGFPGWMTETNGAVDTHTSFPGYYISNPAIQAAFQSFWENAKGPGRIPLQHRVAEIFSALARRVGGNPGVIGYDLLNEPWPGTNWTGCITSPAGCPLEDRGELDPYYARMARAIRKVDTRHLLFAEPFVLFNFGKSQTHIALPGGSPDSGMSFHLYTASPANEPVVLSNAVAWSSSTGGALLNTEFGATKDPVAIDRQVNELDGALIPWIWWSFNGYLAENLRKAPSPANSISAVVTALVRPHPVLVAGTPTSLSYDETTRTMRFTYDTTGPTGVHFGPRARTEFDVPRFVYVYRSGWHATVVGGSVVGGTGGRVLQVAADASSGSVTVTVAPGRAVPATSAAGAPLKGSGSGRSLGGGTATRSGTSREAPDPLHH